MKTGDAKLPKEKLAQAAGEVGMGYGVEKDGVFVESLWVSFQN